MKIKDPNHAFGFFGNDGCEIFISSYARCDTVLAGTRSEYSRVLPVLLASNLIVNALSE